MEKKGTDRFTETIKNHLRQRAKEDPLFIKTLNKENKNIDDCIAYILTQVKKIGAMGYTDDEIFGMAVHYYDEDDLEVNDPIKCNVVINHKPELTPEEIEELRDQARKEVLREQRQRMKKPSTGRIKSNSSTNEQLSLI